MWFLVQTPHPWRGIRQRPHHLMAWFARRGHRVHWVQPRYLRWLVERRRDFLEARREEPLPGLTVQPVTLLNGERLPAVRRCNRSRLARALDAGSGGGEAAGPRILWLYNPHESHLADAVPHDLLVYDIMDEYRGFPWSPPRIAEEEAELLRRADLVFAGTHALHEAKRAMAGGRVECILSGVDRELFAAAGGHGKAEAAWRTSPAHQAIRRRARRLAGYAGMIDQRLDQSLLRAAARALPDWEFVLVGPTVGELARLRGDPRIHLHPPVRHEDLPWYYRAWDAALLPFVESELTRHINPTKMLEYGAAGTPIVARALPDVARFYADGAWLYREPEEFLAHLREIDLLPPDAPAPRQRAALQWAEERGWDRLADRMLAIVEEMLARRRPH